MFSNKLSPRSTRQAVRAVYTIRNESRDRRRAVCPVCLESGGDLIRTCDTCRGAGNGFTHRACHLRWLRALHPRDERRYRCSRCRTPWRCGNNRDIAATMIGRPAATATTYDEETPLLEATGMLTVVILFAVYCWLQHEWAAASPDQRPVVGLIFASFNCAAVALSGSLSVAIAHQQQPHWGLLFISMLGIICTCLVGLATRALVSLDLTTSALTYLLSVIVFMAVLLLACQDRRQRRARFARNQ